MCRNWYFNNFSKQNMRLSRVLTRDLCAYFVFSNLKFQNISNFQFTNCVLNAIYKIYQQNTHTQAHWTHKNIPPKSTVYTYITNLTDICLICKNTPVLNGFCFIHYYFFCEWKKPTKPQIVKSLIKICFQINVVF